MKAGQNFNSPFADQRQEGYRWLLFSDFVEEEFRQFYAESNAQRARLLTVLATATVVLSVVVMVVESMMSLPVIAFNVGILLPTLTITLWASAHPRRHRLYQHLLAFSALLIGMWITSIVTRASMSGMSYYFAAVVAWVFIVWEFVGLPFRHAAFTALTVSGMFIFGSFAWNFQINETVFSTTLLVLANGIGAFCCYQLEYTARRSFLDSKVLAQLAERDGLTGLYNRRSYDEYIERIWRQSRREQAQLTFMLIDIDHFKTFNDQYGHQAGDDALKAVAEVIGHSAQRPLDFAARFGGEEFALVLYGPAQEYGRELPGQIREAVRNLKIVHKQSPTDQYLTVSIGVAMVMSDAKRSMAGAIQMADEALYRAKEEGRNRVVVNAPDAHIQTGRFRASRQASG